MNEELIGKLIAYGLVGGAVALAVLLILRELTLWYFKINTAVKLLEEIRDRLPPKEAPDA